MEASTPISIILPVLNSGDAFASLYWMQRVFLKNFHPKPFLKKRTKKDLLHLSSDAIEILNDEQVKTVSVELP